MPMTCDFCRQPAETFEPVGEQHACEECVVEGVRIERFVEAWPHKALVHYADAVAHPVFNAKFMRRREAAELVFELTPDDRGYQGLPLVLSGPGIDTGSLLLSTVNVGYLPVDETGLWTRVDDFELPGLAGLNLRKKGTGVVHGNTKAVGEIVDAVNAQLEQGRWVVAFMHSYDWSFVVRVFSRDAEASEDSEGLFG